MCTFLTYYLFHFRKPPSLLILPTAQFWWHRVNNRIIVRSDFSGYYLEICHVYDSPTCSHLFPLLLYVQRDQPDLGKKKKKKRFSGHEKKNMYLSGVMSCSSCSQSTLSTSEGSTLQSTKILCIRMDEMNQLEEETAISVFR